MPDKTTFTLDARGLVCPEPVIRTKRLLDEGKVKDFFVIVDNHPARENVCRLARNQGAFVELVEAEGDDFKIHILAENSDSEPVLKEELLPCPLTGNSNNSSRTVVYIGSDTMGSGDDGLGAQLMRGFLRTVIDGEPLPWRIILINSGVKLATLDHEAMEALQMLNIRGVEILSCGTCLERYGLVRKLEVGRITNMFEVVESLNNANKVISPA